MPPARCRNNQTPSPFSSCTICSREDHYILGNRYCLEYLVGVILAAGSESSIPVTLQVIKTTTAKQKMMQLVPYMIIGSTLAIDSLVDMMPQILCLAVSIGQYWH
eukprot:GFUD01053140.1.p1 GENE.GFUD01053140.1~~GFUD01053140.1.p1  ORF type:complete len:105 (-),score=16.72 GFUD01053140.1:85-399(-)